MRKDIRENLTLQGEMMDISRGGISLMAVTLNGEWSQQPH
jgi:hypothetical protein